ncbi:MAG: glutathione S-transferase family protein [Alphaproteobacteria bacterium]
MLELYHCEPLGASAKLLICLKEKGLDYKSHHVDILKLEQFEPDYLKLAPQGQVPVLVDDGKVFTDPSLTLEYLAEKYSNPRLAPSDPSGWYDVQALFNIIDAPLSASLRLLGWNLVMLPSMSQAEKDNFRKRVAALPPRPQQAGWAQVTNDAEASEDQLENARERVRGVVARLETTLAATPWLAGSAYSIADIDAYAQMRTMPSLMPGDINEQKTPKLMKWLSVIENRPAVKAVLAMRKNGKDVYAPPGI